MAKKGIIKGVADFLKGRKRVVIDKKEIMDILPHRGRMLLLDSVVITDGKVMGEFVVTDDVCEGHAVLGEKLVFRGVDILEMAAQVIGVYWGVQHPAFADKKGMLREFGSSKFSKPVFVGDQLVVETSPDRIRDRVLRGPEKERMIIRVTGQGFIARVGDEKKATIDSVNLAVI